MDFIGDLLWASRFSSTYRKEWIADHNWVQIIKHHKPQSLVTVDGLRAAAKRTYGITMDENIVGVYERDGEDSDENKGSTMKFYRADVPRAKVMHTFKGPESAVVVQPVKHSPQSQPQFSYPSPIMGYAHCPASIMATPTNAASAASRQALMDAFPAFAYSHPPVYPHPPPMIPQPTQRQSLFATFPPLVKKAVEPKDCFEKGLLQQFPQKAANTLQHKHEAGSLHWTGQGELKEGAQATLSMQLETTLHCMSNGNEQNAVGILMKALNRQSKTGNLRSQLGEAIRQCEIEDNPSASNKSTILDHTIVDNMRAFVARNTVKAPTGRRRARVQQDAVDAVLVAASFGPKQEQRQLMNPNSLSTRLGVSSGLMAKSLEWSRSMHEEAGKQFEPKVQKKRKDCYREAATVAIREFCHTNEAARVDGRVKKAKLFQVPDPHDPSIIRECPRRIWREARLHKRFELFTKSEAYARFQQDNDNKTISMTLFRDGICPCVRNS